jgi:L,D-transpeptidase catalytic domain
VSLAAGTQQLALPSALAPTWVQALQPIPLWSGPGDAADQLGIVARWDYLQVARPQDGSRLYVLVPRTGGYAYVDALSVGPSGSPPAGWPPPNLPPPPDDLSIGWLATVSAAPLWADADGQVPLGTVPAFTAFKQLDTQVGSRIRVSDPYSGAESFLDAANVGPIDAPARVDSPGSWWGISAVDGANIRSDPSTRGQPVGTLPIGRPIVVSGWVAGEEVIKDNITWARLGDGLFLYSSVLRPVALPSAPPAPPATSGLTGRWIDLNLTLQVAVAYEGDTPVRVARTSTGRPGWETPPGLYRIQRRGESETMASNSLMGLDAQRADYKVENVRWTQYFDADGKALHENYWKPRDEFGIPSSHGCAGLVAEDAKFFWDWTSLGTPIVAHL